MIWVASISSMNRRFLVIRIQSDESVNVRTTSSFVRIRAGIVGKHLHHRCEIQVRVRRVYGQYSIGSEVSQIQSESLPGQQMYRDRIARERVNGDNIEVLRSLVLEGKPRVP